jgi:hypothetical protein
MIPARLLLALALAGLLGCSTPPAPSAASPRLDDPGSEGAVAVVRAYYAAIDRGDYARAYRLWGDGGAASRQTFEEFRDGFAQTADVEVETGRPGRIEGAAGSRYIEIPVSIAAVQRDGTKQRFEGTYVLRRSEVDGATPEQRTWRLYTARIRAVP